MSSSCVSTSFELSQNDLFFRLDRLSHSALRCGVWLCKYRFTTKCTEWQVAYREIACALKLSVRTVIRAIKRLVSEGFITLTPHCRADGGTAANSIRWQEEEGSVIADEQASVVYGSDPVTTALEGAVPISVNTTAKPSAPAPIDHMPATVPAELDETSDNLSEVDRKDLETAAHYDAIYPELLKKRQAVNKTIKQSPTIRLQREYNTIESQIALIESQLPYYRERAVTLVAGQANYSVVKSQFDYIHQLPGVRQLPGVVFGQLAEMVKEVAGNALAYWVNSVIFSIRFGDLSRDYSGKHENPLGKSINIARKQLREGRYQPMAWTEFSEALLRYNG